MRLTRAVWSASTQARLQLYQYAICPYCNKAKAMLDYFKVSEESSCRGLRNPTTAMR